MDETKPLENITEEEKNEIKEKSINIKTIIKYITVVFFIISFIIISGIIVINLQTINEIKEENKKLIQTITNIETMKLYSKHQIKYFHSKNEELENQIATLKKKINPT